MVNLSALSISVSQHAFERAMDVAQSVPVKELESLIIEGVRTGVVVGGAAGRDLLVTPPQSVFSGHVFACAIVQGKYLNVKTVLRQDLAAANLAVFFPTDGSPKKQRRLLKKLKKKQSLKERGDDLE